MPKLRNQVLRADVAKMVRTRTTEKMVLPDQILAVVEDYESGTRTAELFPALKASSGCSPGAEGSDGKGAKHGVGDKGEAALEGGKGKGKVLEGICGKGTVRALQKDGVGGKGEAALEGGKGKGKQNEAGSAAPAEPQQEAGAAAAASAKRRRLTGMFGT